MMRQMRPVDKMKVHPPPLLWRTRTQNVCSDSAEVKSGARILGDCCTRGRAARGRAGSDLCAGRQGGRCTGGRRVREKERNPNRTDRRPVSRDVELPGVPAERSPSGAAPRSRNGASLSIPSDCSFRRHETYPDPRLPLRLLRAVLVPVLRQAGYRTGRRRRRAGARRD